MIVDRTLNRGNDVRERGEVEHTAAFPHVRVRLPGFGDVHLVHDETRIVLYVPEVLRAARREVVEDNDLVAVGEQAIDQVASDEAGAARHDASHGTLLTHTRRV